MPLLFILRALFSLISVAILCLAVWLLWTWYRGEEVIDPEGVVRTLREDWRLWWGLGLLAFSFLGGFVVKPLLARPDRDPVRFEHAPGQEVRSKSGASLYVQTTGREGGTPIILVHGWSLDSTSWAYARRDLEKDFSLTLWDLPGLGRSRPAGPDGISLSAFAKDLQTLVELSGRKPILVGHSIGGMIIQTLARDEPAFFSERVAGAVLVNTTFTDPLKTTILPRLMQALRWPLIVPMMKLTIWLEPLA